MAILRAKEIKDMKEAEKEKKLQELKIELMKSAKATQGGSNKTREIKRTIARLKTIK
jgi:ribosomal protein L29